ncbi:MAG: SIR2 family protein, partial [Desulfobaccales bacterium]
LARRRSVIFLGAGISRHSKNHDGRRPKAWVELLQSMAQGINPNRHIMSLIREKDYLTACEVLKEAVGRDAFHEQLRDEFSNPGFQHALIHEEIFKLDSRIVATPNFDKIYETYANHAAGGSIIIKHHFDPDIAEAIRGTDRVIFKVHGTIDSPNRMIFTRKEYAEAREKYRSFYSLLEALYLTHTFIFLGCGVNDPDIRLLLEDNFFRHPSCRPHMFVLPHGEIHNSIKGVLQESMNVRFITYKPAHDHRDLVESIGQLVTYVDNMRDELGKTRNW